MSVDLEVDLSDSDNDIFIFITGILNRQKQCVDRSGERHFVAS